MCIIWAEYWLVAAAEQVRPAGCGPLTFSLPLTHWSECWYWDARAFYILLIFQAVIVIAVLETAALLASPGPRRGRTLLTWGHGARRHLAVHPAS